ncbi:unnamed protein product [marine sediment metagenome]|uniref:Uncharacterized protein n=1 Tax=marine sediment metagenome TaxID=412755 RepID=X1CQS5_9ZZZZ
MNYFRLFLSLLAGYLNLSKHKMYTDKQKLTKKLHYETHKEEYIASAKA